MINFETKNGTDGLVLRGYRWPVASPKAVMSLVHGFGEHCGRYDDMATYLNARGIAVNALDLRGHGRSDGPRGVAKNYDLMRGDVEILLDISRQDYPDIAHILYGHSMGGGLVIHHVLKEDPNNLKAVIASAPLLELPKPPPSIATPIFKGLRKIAPGMALKNKIDGTKVSRLPEEQNIYVSDPLNHGSLGIGLAVDMIEGGAWSINNAAHWTLPLLIVHAQDDQLTSPKASEAFAAKIPSATYKAYDNCAHEIHNDCHRADVYETTADFIESHI